VESGSGCGVGERLWSRGAVEESGSVFGVVEVLEVLYAILLVCCCGSWNRRTALLMVAGVVERLWSLGAFVESGSVVESGRVCGAVVVLEGLYC